ncbi:hypothetical protein [Kribbella speibonae]|uniref:Repetin n=1 Tax=Kribbella speibonae TaxID=1572660 RepID=A0ABY2A7S7_9ACTN|nr:hypothetical protein [Kribbella speibonae]TCC24664.1 hypothetical protein E0H58_10595 [Kribbella speibonae]
MNLVGKLAILTVVGATAVAGITTAQAEPARAKVARVSGAADFMLPFHPDDDVRHFAFDATATPYTRPISGAPQGLPTDARGTVEISHYVAALKQTVRAEGTVDCLVTAPGTATLTAKITRADELIRDWVGKRLGFSVQDNGRHDRVGLSWTVVNLNQKPSGEWEESSLGTCMAPAPFAPVTKGDYKVRHVELPQAPTS